ncbi:MAG: hypothetical protein PUJ51_16940 [Clostridiales bacterium]|uniref:hypothetical protein n=1 Tax=Terrisporobacter sp. TaxID=1965305 RepID=UPI002A404564|nr:hypothetical protein [Terrisporobacter sp.]MCI7205317.1 hypothetical protein [Clostridium sp.]MDD5879346.1 hypothetical protein [Clostridiales bacterium]MDD7756176.1 hypothetical protein [Clostridiales bacterium]MDY4133997.1 hypothetical protein [Terrisporobacter sp.]MDY4735442.1 hypothetical protein [Terrisporobacter sp.]
MKENLIRNSYLNSFNIDDKSKGLEHLIIINTKCLVDDKIQRYVYIDNNRLKDELRYYNFYGTKPSYDDILNILLPLILSNTNIQKCEDEVVSLIQKYVKYLKKEDNLFEYILGAVIYNALMHYLLENKNIEYNDLLQLLKEKIIGFSIELEKLNMIKFQMARINAIQLIDNYIYLKVEDYQDGKIIRNLLNVIYDIYIEERNVNNTGVLSIKKSILSILGEESNLNMDNIDFLEQMSHYITKIRKYAINKKTYNLNSDPRNLIKYNEGDIVSDAILNKINIVSKELHDNILHIKVKSKSGEYNFKFKKA